MPTETTLRAPLTAAQFRAAQSLLRDPALTEETKRMIRRDLALIYAVPDADMQMLAALADRIDP